MGGINKDAAREFLQHLTQHIDVSDNSVRFVGRDVLLPDPYKTQQGSHCERVEQ
jgi:hemerythrin-like domain-containing protein